MYVQAHAYAYARPNTDRTLDMRCDGPRRRPPPLLSRRDRQLLDFRMREQGYRHSDAPERSRLLVDIGDEIDARALFRADAHRAAGLAPHALDDGTLTTAQLQAALDVLRGLPTP